MSQDQHSYGRAAAAALIGLGVQLLLAIVIALTGIWSQSPAVGVAAWHLFGGLAIWAVLWIIFHQHKLERAEALEAEQIAQSDTDAAALFDAHGDELAVARQRLNRLYKYGLTIVSAVMLVYLLAVGLWQIAGANAALSAQEATLATGVLDDRANPLVLATVALVSAFVAFIIARYQSGMTLLKEAQLLRGGASYLIGNALALGLIALAAGVAEAGRPEALGIARYAIAGLMVLLGVEVLLLLLLNIYRPRTPGETPRPAYDSRLLGWLTSPESLAVAIGEALNYQFGFEVSRSWFYRLLGKAFAPLVAFGVLVLVALSSVVIVEPHEQAVITRFGAIARDEPARSGLHFKLPWPIGHAEKYPVERVLQVEVGSSEGGLKQGALLWTNTHAAEGTEEEFMVTATRTSDASAADGEADSGQSLIGGQVIVQYRITDLMTYINSADQPEEVFRAVVEQAVNDYFVTHDIDFLLGEGRIVAGDQIAENIRATLNDPALGLDLGLDVIYAGLIAVHPPQEQEVAQAFQKQVGALQEKQTLIEAARGEAIDMLASVAGSVDKAEQLDAAIRELEGLQNQLQDAQGPDAEALRERIARKQVTIESMLTEVRGEAASEIFDALAFRWSKALGERAKANRFASELAIFQQAPRLYRMTRYLEALGQGVGDSRKYVVASQTPVPPLIRLNLEDAQSNLDTLFQD